MTGSSTAWPRLLIVDPDEIGGQHPLGSALARLLWGWPRTALGQLCPGGPHPVWVESPGLALPLVETTDHSQIVERIKSFAPELVMVRAAPTEPRHASLVADVGDWPTVAWAPTADWYWHLRSGADLGAAAALFDKASLVATDSLRVAQLIGERCDRNITVADPGVDQLVSPVIATERGGGDGPPVVAVLGVGSEVTDGLGAACARAGSGLDIRRYAVAEPLAPLGVHRGGAPMEGVSTIGTRRELRAVVARSDAVVVPVGTLADHVWSHQSVGHVIPDLLACGAALIIVGDDDHPWVGPMRQGGAAAVAEAPTSADLADLVASVVQQAEILGRRRLEARSHADGLDARRDRIAFHALLIDLAST